ncbi:uncharacterized protein BKA78DRAFT_356101 [Phyllosticta capitalensis]|uniref:uncharacterized protein n=1 Tax=Phyllosticta capitalensis TaxID=121624 RepID=UPI00312F5EE7
MSKSEKPEKKSKKERSEKKEKKSKREEAEAAESAAATSSAPLDTGADFVALPTDDQPAEDAASEHKNSKARRKERREAEMKEKAKEEKKAKKKAKKEAEAQAAEQEESASKSKETSDKPKKSKKRKHDETDDESAPAEKSSKTKEAKSEKKDKKKRKKNDGESAQAEAPAVLNDAAQEASTGDAPEESTQKGKAEPEEGMLDENGKQKTRFICFIGNLPYTANAEAVAKHFEKVHPISIRAPMRDDNKKSKGFAFLEFDRYDYMKSCLKLYHHSLFDAGKGKTRKINVELTAGGGGNTEARKERIQYKNERLNEQRKRRWEQEQKEAKRAGRKKAAAGEEAQYDGAADEAEAEDAGESHHAGIHPSRLAMMQR